ncbi:MAG: NHL repeat-containing protein [Dehalococcoidia bacterium]
MVTQLVAGRVFDFSHAIGRGGGGGMGFSTGNAMVVGNGDDVYILSRGGEAITAVPWNRTARGARVGKFTVGSEAGDEEFVHEFGKYGDAPGEFIWPAGIALDSQENIYVTDEWMNQVSVFSNEGTLLNTWGVSGSGEGEFDGPSGIARDAEDNFYIVDSRNHRVQKFTKDGQFLLSWGSYGSGEGQLDSPWGITIDHQGYVYVADYKNHRAQKFTPEGQFIAQFGRYGTGRGELNHPSDVTVDPDGDVYICDWANNRVQVFGPDGKFVTSFIGDARELTKWSEMIVRTNPDALKRRREIKNPEIEWRLAMPRSVAFDSVKSRLLILDTQRSRVQIYNKLKEYVGPARNL